MELDKIWQVIHFRGTDWRRYALLLMQDFEGHAGRSELKIVDVETSTSVLTAKKMHRIPVQLTATETRFHGRALKVNLLKHVSSGQQLSEEPSPRVPRMAVAQRSDEFVFWLSSVAILLSLHPMHFVDCNFSIRSSESP